MKEMTLTIISPLKLSKIIFKTLSYLSNLLSLYFKGFYPSLMNKKPLCKVLFVNSLPLALLIWLMEGVV